MFSVEVNVGRLLEIRLAAPITLEDLQGMGQALGEIFHKHQGRLVSAADATRAAIVSTDVGARVVDVFRTDNPRIERSGILINQSATFGLQIERLVAKAENKARRCFHDAFELKAFLGTLLTRAEHARLAQFLSER
ncbi:MAG TPA: hypothetical protein VFA20_31625 [Myxococcaceae bacterium]|nr:hypothetical protein [Myxococcaceae bacterium]